MVDVPEGEARDGLLVGCVGLPYLQKRLDGDGDTDGDGDSDGGDGDGPH